MTDPQDALLDALASNSYPRGNYVELDEDTLTLGGTWYVDELINKLRGIFDIPARGKTIADRIYFDACVNNRAREIVNTRELFSAATEKWEYGLRDESRTSFYGDITECGDEPVTRESFDPPLHPSEIIVRRRKAGAWEVVE